MMGERRIENRKVVVMNEVNDRTRGKQHRIWRLMRGKKRKKEKWRTKRINEN